MSTGSATTKRIALVASILGSGIVFLDGTIVNVALPAIRAGLHGALSDQQWVVEAYLLTLSSLILIGGSLGDLFGRRRVFSIGLVGFRGVLAAVRDRAEQRGPDRRAGAAGRGRRDAGAEHARADHGQLSGARARRRDRKLDGLDGDRRP